MKLPKSVNISPHTFKYIYYEDYTVDEDEKCQGYCNDNLSIPSYMGDYPSAIYKICWDIGADIHNEIMHVREEAENLEEAYIKTWENRCKNDNKISKV